MRKNLPVIPGLYGLRAVAVLLVLVEHFFDWRRYERYEPGPLVIELPSAALSWVSQSVQAGRLGVFLFFCISGFLITRLLVSYREADGAWRLFMVRRALRIFPVYIVALAAYGLSGQVDPRDWPYFLTYTVNIGQMFGQAAGEAGHFWTLAVEEQFYLLWPLVILFLPVRSHVRVTGACICVSLIAVVLLYSVDQPYGFASRSPIGGCSLALTLGAALALMPTSHRTAAMAFTPAGLAGLILLAVLRDPDRFTYPYLLFHDVVFAVFGCGLVALVLSWPKLGHAIDWRPLRYLGVISYGVYAYHMLIFADWMPAAPSLLSSHALTDFLYRSFVAVTLAALSWHLLERPLLRLRPTGRAVPATT